MSRTYAHRPRWVWMNDHPGLVREHHNHDAGVCTLLAPPYTEANVFGNGGTCYVYLDWNVRTCSCGMCSGRWYHRLAKRQTRAAVRTLLLAARRGAAATQLETLEADAAQIDRSAG